MRLQEETHIILYFALLIHFNILKQALSRAPSVSISNTNKSSLLYLHSDKGQGLGLVDQSAGDSIDPVAYLSKQLDPIYSNWTTCPKVLAPAALLIPEAQKITFNLPMTVWSSHNIQDLISNKSLNSISPSLVHILHFFLSQPDLTFW
jgi:hypothetical protein